MATKSVKATEKKTTLDKNVDRIQKTAKNVEKEVVKTANVVVDNMKADSKELQALATKTVKEAGKKLDLKKNVEMIQNTAKSVNEQILKTAEEVMEDFTKTGKVALKKAIENTREAIENFDVDKQVKEARKTAQKVNAAALETADEMVDDFFSASEKWQKVAEKAVKGGLHLAGRQQEIFFDTLEGVKGQFTKSAVRFRKIFSNN
jgi:hypothetical protein